MTIEELAELFLAHLYELAEEASHPNFLFSVNDFAPKLGITDREELQKAIDYLGDRGLIFLASVNMLGGISAGLTMEGSVFVEKGGETGMIERYRKYPQTVIRTPAEPSPPAAGRERTGTVKEEKKGPCFALGAVEAILEDIKHVLERDDTVTEETKKDLLADVATLKIQLERNVKNRQIIDFMMDSLSKTPSIAPLVAGLRCIVEVYFG